MFVAEYESFFISKKSKYDVLEFDDLCSTSKCLVVFPTEFDSLPTSFKLKPLLDSPKYSFFGTR